MNIANKTILVTGANRGIGRALLEEALRRGARKVYAGTRGVLQHSDKRVTPLTLDVTSASQIQEAVKEVDMLDVLINNAGVAIYDDLGNLEVLEQTFAVNFFGLLRVTNAFLPLLKRSKGAILNNLSMAGIAPLPIIPSYSTSKAAALNLTQSLRALLASQGVTVHAAVLGPVDTDMNRGFEIPKAAPETAAAGIFDGLEKGEEEIFPDPASHSIAEGWRNGVSKALEREFKAFVPGPRRHRKGPFMQSLKHQSVLIVGGSRGLGLGVVEALAAHDASVTVIARDAARLTDLKARLGVSVIAGDATDPSLAESAIREVRPSVLVLNAGATPVISPLHKQTWESFSRNWETDVKATFHWIQAALKAPLPRGSRVLISSSGAAIAGSPLSGSYAGAKRMIWLMANYANGAASDLDLGIRFQALLVGQIVGSTELGHAAAEAYARKKGVTTEAFLAGFGKPLDPRDYGDHVAALLTNPKYESAPAFAIRGETGIEVLAA